MLCTRKCILEAQIVPKQIVIRLAHEVKCTFVEHKTKTLKMLNLNQTRKMRVNAI